MTNPGFKKCPSLSLKIWLFEQNFQKLRKTVLAGLSSPKPNFSGIASVTGIFHKTGVVVFNFSSN
jgi:hypothetical protein